MVKGIRELPLNKKLLILALFFIIVILVVTRLYTALCLEAAPTSEYSCKIIPGMEKRRPLGILILIVLSIVIEHSLRYTYNKLKEELDIVQTEHTRLMPYEEFIEEYSKKGLIEVRDTPVGKLDIIEELDMIKEAKDIKVCYTPTIFEPRELKEILGNIMYIYEELIKKELKTLLRMPMRVISRDDKIIKTEGVPYQYVYMFHYSPDLIVSTSRGRLRVRDILWKFLFENGKMIPVNKSKFPNPLGVHILAFTRDGYSVLIKRSGKGLVAARYRLSIIEGTPSIESVLLQEKSKDGWCYTLHDLAIDKIREEIGINSAKIYAISYFRSPWVMGKPSIGMIALLDSYKSDIKKSWQGDIVAIKVADNIERLEDLKGINIDKLYKIAAKGTPTLKWLVLKLSEIIGDDRILRVGRPKSRRSLCLYFVSYN